MLYPYKPQDRSKPGDTLRETMAAANLTPAALARKTGLPLPEVNCLLCSQIGTTPETAAKLETALDTPAAFWLKLDENYRAVARPIQTAEKHR